MRWKLFNDYMEKLFNDLNMSVNSVISADHSLKNEKVYGKNKKI
jgi:hypothetical protein